MKVHDPLKHSHHGRTDYSEACEGCKAGDPSRPIYLYGDMVDGWWVIEDLGIDRSNWTTITVVRQISANEERDVMRHRGPFPTKEMAQEFQYVDMLEDYWDAGMAVYAAHCLGCGKWAKVLAFNDSAGQAWRVTECPKCGILDSRPTRCPDEWHGPFADGKCVDCGESER